METATELAAEAWEIQLESFVSVLLNVELVTHLVVSLVSQHPKTVAPTEDNSQQLCSTLIKILLTPLSVTVIVSLIAPLATIFDACHAFLELLMETATEHVAEAWEIQLESFASVM